LRAIVLAGGKGVRLRPLTFALPKPLIPVGEQPILEDIVRSLAAAGFKDIHLTVGYRAELLQTYFQDGAQFGVRIHYVRESEPLGTAGALALVRDALPAGEPVLVMNGDILTRMDFRAFVAWHRRDGFALTIAVRDHEMQVPFGVLTLEGDRVVGVREKPSHRYVVSAGIYVVEPRALRLVPSGRRFDMPDLATALVAAGDKVGAYRFGEPWLAVDRLDQLEEANRLVAEWKAR
jgi:NDP-sugar pyrophosphorylase family protein